MIHLQYNIPNEEVQLELGAQLAKVCHSSVLIFLYGDLGAGKTTLVRGFLRGLGYEGKVRSPTYTLVEPYSIAGYQLIHADLYRLTEGRDLLELGLIDQLDDKTICFIEWPERAQQQLPMADFACYIAHLSNGRELRLIAYTAKGEQILQALEQTWGV